MLASRPTSGESSPPAGRVLWGRDSKSDYDYDAPPSGRVGDMTVLEPGDTLHARNQFGTFEVIALTKTRRHFVIHRRDEGERSIDVDLDPRRAAFHGLTGIYGGARYGPSRSQISVQEGHLYLHTLHDVETCLAVAPSMGYVVTNDGLAIGLFDAKYEVLAIDIFRIFVDGQPISKTCGNGEIRLTRAIR